MNENRKFDNLINKKFNKLTIIELDEEKTNNNKEGKAYWWCRCDCGKMTRKSLSTSELKSNNTKSCGLCMTFEDWCIENNRQDILNRWNYKLNDCKPSDITSSSGKKFYFKCLNNSKHNDEFRSIHAITHSKDYQITCSTCNSFAQWGINNLGNDFLEKYWDLEKNNELDINPWKISKCNTKIKIFIKCQEVIYHDSYKCIPATFVKGNRCPYCTHTLGKTHPKDSFAQWCIDTIDKDFIKKYWSDKNTVNPFKLSKNSKVKVWIKCQEKDYHKNYEILCANFIKGKRCPYCINHKIHPKDSLGQYITDKFGQEFLDKIWSDKNKKSAFEYSPKSQQKVWWKCFDNKHEDFKREICSSNVLDFRCQKCSQERKESMLQEKVRLYLKSLNYDILHEENCSIVPINPKTKYLLPFDNEIRELKLICEVNGEQHYFISGFHKTQAKKHNTTPEQEFNYQRLKDRYKRIKAIQQGYYYLEIPYWTDDENGTWKQLIDNKIKEIQENAKLNQVI